LIRKAITEALLSFRNWGKIYTLSYKYGERIPLDIEGFPVTFSIHDDDKVKNN
jgi:hypothetical protein